jgi:hypothetical protein
MAFLRRLLGLGEEKPPGAAVPPADAVLDDDEPGAAVDAYADLERVSVWLPLVDAGLQDAREQALVFGIEDRIMRRLFETRVGDHDTNSLERGFMVIRLVGPDAEAIVALVTPLLADARPGSYLAVRKGPAGTGEERVDVGALSER